jgi:hypothetical protein
MASIPHGNNSYGIGLTRANSNNATTTAPAIRQATFLGSRINSPASKPVVATAEPWITPEESTLPKKNTVAHTKYTSESVTSIIRLRDADLFSAAGPSTAAPYQLSARYVRNAPVTRIRKRSDRRWRKLSEGRANWSMVSAAWCGRPSHALPSAKMAAQGDDVPQLRGAFRTALASGGWASPETLGHANSLAIALWSVGDHAEAEATLLDAQKNVNEDAFAQTPRGRSALEDLAFALGYIDAAPEADALYGRVIALSTDAGDEVDSLWWSRWASVKVKLARWDEAISLRRKALDAAVRFDGAQSNAALVEYYFLADTLRQSGCADEALAVAQAGLEVADETQAYMIRPLSKARILALQDLGDADATAEAVRDLRAAAATWSAALQQQVHKWLADSGLGPFGE